MRANPRPKLPRARIRFRSWDEFATFLTQDSERGLFVRLGQPPALGTELEIEFLFPDLSELALRARVVHRIDADQAAAARGEPGMGVQFTDMSAEQAAQLQALIGLVEVKQSIARSEGRSIEPPPDAASSLRPGSSVWQDKRVRDAYALLDRSRFDAAERLAAELLAERPNDEVKVLLLLIQARRQASQFDFEGALRKYGAVLELQPDHVEAQDQLRQLHDELAHSADLFERVFGSRKG